MVFDTGFHSVAQASLKPMIPLPQTPGLQVCATMPELHYVLMFRCKIYSLKPFICLKDIVLHTCAHDYTHIERTATPLRSVVTLL